MFKHSRRREPILLSAGQQHLDQEFWVWAVGLIEQSETIVFRTFALNDHVKDGVVRAMPWRTRASTREAGAAATPPDQPSISSTSRATVPDDTRGTPP